MSESITVPDNEWNIVRADTWVNGVKKVTSLEYHASATVTDGVATFNLTDDGTANGNAVFTNVYKESARFWVDNNTDAFQFGTYTLAGNKKTLSVNINKLGTVIVGVIQFVSAANDTVVYLTIKGD